MDSVTTSQHDRNDSLSADNADYDLVGYLVNNFQDLASFIVASPVDEALDRHADWFEPCPEFQSMTDCPRLARSLRALLIEECARSLHLPVLGLLKAISATGSARLGADSPIAIDDLLQRQGLELLTRAHPDIAVMIHHRLDLEVEALCEALQRFLVDHARLVERGLVNDSSRLKALTTLGEESHDRGRRPLLFQFSCGLALVYKPRSLGMETTWYWVLEQVATEAGLSCRRQPVLLDCSSHGWMQLISHQPASSPAALNHYFQHFGMQLAIARALGIGDLHSENVIAVNDEPVMVDCEVFTAMDFPWHDEGLKSHFATVLGTGLLPWTIVEKGKPTLNRAGLATGPNVTRQHWRAAVGPNGLLEPMRADEIVPSAHSPFGEPASPPDWVELGQQLATGFAMGYRALLRLIGRTAFSSELKSALDGQLVRVLPRTTNHYSQILTALSSPAGLKSQADRERMLDKLRLAEPYCPGINTLVPWEQTSLQQGDVPAFKARIGSRHLYWEGQRVASNFFPVGSESLVERRLDHLGEADLRGQTRLIQETFGQFRSPGLQQPVNRRPGNLQTAEALGNLLLESKVSGYWFEAHANGDHASLSRLDTSLEKGILGPALLFAGLVAQGNTSWEAPAHALLEASLNVPPMAMLQRGAGGHAGLGGQIFALCASARLLNDSNWLAQATTLLPVLQQALQEDHRLDLMAGCAGGMLAALELFRLTDDEAALACARSGRSRLLDGCIQTESGLAWPSCTEADQRPLTGMAHGSSGMRMALARLQAVDPDPRVPAMLEAAARFEKNRHDWLLGGADRNQGEAWCRGTLGLALAWSEQYRLLGEPLPDFMARSLPDACQRYLTDNHSLCHGTLGNLLMIKRLNQAFPGQIVQSELAAVIRRLVDEINHGEVLCGSRPRRVLHGMMAGLSGIGYGLLMLNEPDWPDPLRLIVSP